MAIVVQDVYSAVCYACLEPGGLALGLVSEADFLTYLTVAVMDFANSTPLDKKIFTEQVDAGTSQYTVPEDVQYGEMCFYAGKLIEKTSESELAASRYQWRNETGAPELWHADNLPPKVIEVVPNPTVNGTVLGGSPPGAYGDFFPTQNNLSIMGPALPSKTSWGLGDTIDDMPESLQYYLVFRILEQVFSSDGEMRDIQRAAYCRTRFQEGLSLVSAIAKDELGEPDA